jgi:hypothetical protein
MLAVVTLFRAPKAAISSRKHLEKAAYDPEIFLDLAEGHKKQKNKFVK